jgi:tetratricopeptide (TPR) repeat protein
MSPKPCAPRLSVPRVCFVIAIILLLTAAQLQGQRRGPGADSAGLVPPMENPGASGLDLSQNNVVVDASGKTVATNEYACFLPPLNSLAAGTVGVVDLQVPWKIHLEYESGCDALRRKKIADAEKHLRKAVGQYQKYAAAWVLLGQLLEVQQKPEEALDACSKSLNASDKYLPAYLCLTDISARQKKWNDVLTFSEGVLKLDSTNAVAYAYNATANLNLHHLLEAERSALKALEIDVRNTEPRVHFLLAQIYVAKGDRPNAVAQLREYLRFAKDPDDVAMVKNNLAKFDGEVAK